MGGGGFEHGLGLGKEMGRGIADDTMEGVGAMGLEGAQLSRLFRSSDSLVSLTKNFDYSVGGDGSVSGSDVGERLPKMTFGPGMAQKHPWTGRRDSGINCCHGNSRGDEIYYVGIIDILQQYNLSKRAENFFKGFTSDRDQISAVDAKKYAARFIAFMNENID